MRARPGLALAGAIAVRMAVAGMVSIGDGDARAHAADGHPARIQEGACDNLGRAAFNWLITGRSLTQTLQRLIDRFIFDVHLRTANFDA